jgi:hypothetical protein
MAEGKAAIKDGESERDRNRRPVCSRRITDRTARPDVSTGLRSSESGIPADPPTPPVTRDFARQKGWSSNVIPRLIPNMIPRMNPQRMSL